MRPSRLSRLYRVLLALYPSAEVDRVGDDMVECFEDLVEGARRRRGALGVMWVVLRTLAELPFSAWGSHRQHRGNRRVLMESVWRDIRFAVRGMMRSPGFTLLAALSLGLGVGANTSIYSVFAATLWNKLPVPEADRLVRMYERREEAHQVSYPNFRDALEGAGVFEGGFQHGLQNFSMLAGDLSQLVTGETVTSDYFNVLGIEPLLGRFIDPVQHEAPTSDPVVVLSHYLWTTAFGADPQVIGRTIKLNEHPFTVIGVAPESFQGTKFGLAMDLWVPLRQWAFADGWSEGWELDRGRRSMLTVVKLAPGVSLEAANAALATVSRRLAETYPDADVNMTLGVLPEVSGQIAPDQAGLPDMIGLLAVLGSSLVLLVACGNVASLLLARAVARRREIGMRVALGAGRLRIVRQLMTESLLLALLGAAAGIGLAAVASRFTGVLLPRIPYRFAIDTAPDARTVVFASLASLGAVFVFGLAPALQASRLGISGVIRGDDGASGMRVRGATLLNSVVVGVVALAFVTLFLAGLFGTSLGYVRTIDPGFATAGRAMGTFDLSLADYDDSEVGPFQDQVLDQVGAIPGVEHVALTSSIPMGDFSSSSRVYADDREYAPEELGPDAWVAAITPDWFETAGTRILAGRSFTGADDERSPDVVIVNQALAEILWPNESPLGRRIRYGRTADGHTMEVVGVAETGKYSMIVERPQPAMYLPMRQHPGPLNVLLASTSGDPAALVAPIRDVLHLVDPSMALYDVKTSEEQMRNAWWLYRLGAQLGLVIGLLAASMAAGGLYGVMAFRVGQRKREMGIRLALGAGKERVLRLVLSGTLRLVGIGALIGALVSFAASGVVRSIVFGVEPTSPLYLVGVGVTLSALAVLATLVPALGAARADLVRAIRTE